MTSNYGMFVCLSIKISALLTLFPVCLRNLLIDGLEPVLSNTEKSCIASIYIQFSMKIKIKIIPVVLAQTFGPMGLTKLDLVFFNIRGKLL